MIWVRTTGWIATAAIGYVVVGALALYAASYTSAILAPQSDEREFVVAGATLVWSLLGACLVLLLGRVLAGPLKSPSVVGWAVIGIGLVAATAASFVVVADARRAFGYFEPDSTGLAVAVGPALLAAALAVLASEVGPRRSDIAWRTIAVIGAVVVIGLSVLALLNGGPATGVASTLGLLASVAYAVTAGTWSTSRLLKRVSQEGQRNSP